MVDRQRAVGLFLQLGLGQSPIRSEVDDVPQKGFPRMDGKE